MNEGQNSMKKLDETGKENYFTTPEGYFDELPMRIQAGMATEPVRTPVWVHLLKYSIPAVLLLVMAYFLVQRPIDEEPAELLAQITMEEAIEYLSAADINTQDLIDLTVSEDELYDIVKAPTRDELYILEEEMLESIDWGLEEVEDLE